MKVLIISILLLFQVYSVESNILTSPSPDTVYIQQANSENWWARNEGAIISTLGGVLIAILASFLTYAFSKRRISIKEEEVYQGILYSVHLELDWQLNHNRMLRGELLNLQRLSLEEGRFIVERAPDEFHTDYIENCRERILDYDSFNHKIIAFLSTYINILIDANRHIDFSVARSLDLGDDIDHRRELIENYFQKIEENCLSKIDNIIPQIRALIEDELIDYDQELINTETDKTKLKINDLLLKWNAGEINEEELLEESKKLFRETFKGFNPPKSDHRSIVVEVLSYLEIFNDQLILKEDIPDIRDFLNTPKGDEKDAWQTWEMYWEEINFEERREQLQNDDFYTTDG